MIEWQAIPPAIAQMVEDDYNKVMTGGIGLYDEEILQMWSDLSDNNSIGEHHIAIMSCEDNPNYRVRIDINVGHDKLMLRNLIGIKNMMGVGNELFKLATQTNKDIIVQTAFMFERKNEKETYKLFPTPAVGAKLAGGYATPCPVHGKLFHLFLLDNDKIYKENYLKARQEFNQRCDDLGFVAHMDDDDKGRGFVEKTKEILFLDSMSDRACGGGYEYVAQLLSLWGVALHPNHESTIGALSKKISQAIMDNDVVMFE